MIPLLDGLTRTFFWILEASLKGTILIAFVALIHLLAGTRLAAKWRFAMWLVVVVRLALPVAPQSSLSLFELTRFPSWDQRRTLQPSPMTAPIVRSAPFRPERILISSAETTLLPTRSTVRTLAVIWFAGAFLLLLRMLIATIRLRSVLRRTSREVTEPEPLAMLAECRAELRIRSRVRLIQTSSIQSPALQGVLNPSLLLPDSLLKSFSRDELRFIFLHELAHLRRFDLPVSWAMAILQIIHWFNPAVWLAFSRIREERELACDAATLTHLACDERPRYGQAILKLLECFRTPMTIPGVVGMINRKEQMKRRITMIARFKAPSRLSILFSLVVLALATVSLTDARGGERHRMLNSDVQATADLLDQRISLQLENVTVAELLASLGSRTGVAISMAPELANDSVQQSRVTVRAENVPAHLVIAETLLLGLNLDLYLEANRAVTIRKATGVERIRLDDGGENTEVEIIRSKGVKPEHDVMVFKGGPGQTVDEEITVQDGRLKVVRKIDGVVMEGKEGEDRIFLRGPTPEPGHDAIRIDVKADTRIDKNGTKVIKRKLVLSDENGNADGGKLDIEIHQPATKK